MGINEEDIAKVRSSVDLVQIIGEHTEIKRSGRSWMARCPLHGERTPSLSVSPEKGVYYCFGCQRSGDAISFVQEIDNLDFVGAVESLAGRFGVTLRYTSKDEGAGRARKRGLLDAVGKAVEFYHHRLLNSPDAGEARSYLRSRGYDGEIVRLEQAPSALIDPCLTTLNDYEDGVISTFGSPPSITDTTEFVVPRSIPIVLAILKSPY